MSWHLESLLKADPLNIIAPTSHLNHNLHNSVRNFASSSSYFTQTKKASHLDAFFVCWRRNYLPLSRSKHLNYLPAARNHSVYMVSLLITMIYNKLVRNIVLFSYIYLTENVIIMSFLRLA